MERALKHKFPVGTTVYFTASNVSRPAASGTYEVIRLLPSDGDDRRVVTAFGSVVRALERLDPRRQDLPRRQIAGFAERSG